MAMETKIQSFIADSRNQSEFLGRLNQPAALAKGIWNFSQVMLLLHIAVLPIGLLGNLIIFFKVMLSKSARQLSINRFIVYNSFLNVSLCLTNFMINVVYNPANPYGKFF